MYSYLVQDKCFSRDLASYATSFLPVISPSSFEEGKREEFISPVCLFIQSQETPSIIDTSIIINMIYSAIEQGIEARRWPKYLEFIIDYCLNISMVYDYEYISRYEYEINFIDKFQLEANETYNFLKNQGFEELMNELSMIIKEYYEF